MRELPIILWLRWTFILTRFRSVEEALAPLRELSPKADIRVVSLDLASEKSIRAAAKEILAFDTPIDVSS